MLRLHLSRGVARPDLAAGAMVVVFALALGVTSARSELLALTTLLAAIWIGWDALAHDQRGPRAGVVMAFALVMLGALPALLLAFDRGLWIAPPRLHGLNGGLALWSVGIAAVAVGARAARVLGPPPSGARAVASWQRRGAGAIAIVVVIVVISLAAFIHEVGGPLEYIKNLNNSAATNAGLTYLIWGMSFAKYGAFAYLAESWASGRTPSRRTLATTALAMVIMLFLGSRLLVLVAIIQLLLLYAALRPIGGRFILSISTAVVIGAVVFIGLGEYRRWENVAGSRPSFAHYFVHTSLPSLPRTYVNNYADTVRSSVLVRHVVPAHAPYEYGKELLRVLLQPLPGGIRPKIAVAPALETTFTSGHGNGSALPLPVEGYIEFGFAGDVLFCVALGLVVGLVDRLGPRARDVGWVTTAAAASTGLVIIFRGSLHTGIAIAGIDVIGFFAAHRVLFAPADGRRRPAGSGAAGVAADPDVAAAA